MVAGPSPVVRIELDLLDDGEPATVYRPVDGRGAWVLPFIGNAAGFWRLEARVSDARGCRGASETLPQVRVR